MKLTYLIKQTMAGLLLLLPALAFANTPVTKDGVTTIHLDEHNGYFSSPETLVKLKPGKYKFIIKNKSGKLVGFWLQDAKSYKFLDKFPIEKGQTRTTDIVNVTTNGFRYRCPINPTPWYDVNVGE
jgi:hypothetical protein